jgi:hypothetical protein
MGDEGTKMEAGISRRLQRLEYRLDKMTYVWGRHNVIEIPMRLKADRHRETCSQSIAV